MKKIDHLKPLVIKDENNTDPANTKNKCSLVCINEDMIKTCKDLILKTKH